MHQDAGEYDLFAIDLFIGAMYALHTTYEYELTPTDSEADKMVTRKKMLEAEFLAIEQTAVAKLKNLDWKNVGVMHTYEFLYFRSHHPSSTERRLSRTISSSTTRWWSPRWCTRSRSSTCRPTAR